MRPGLRGGLDFLRRFLEARGDAGGEGERGGNNNDGGSRSHGRGDDGLGPSPLRQR